MSSPDTTVAPDPSRAAAIARAERLRGMLERLAEIGMAMAEEMGERHLTAPYHPEPRHEPGRAFGSVSRGVRLTVALVLRLDADIIAMCNGGPLPAQPAGQPLGFGAKAPPCPVREKVREAVHAVIDGEIGDAEVAMLALDRAHETLTERDDIDRFLDRPLRECVAAICADLGLAPDWSLWSDEDGFVAPEAGPAHDWSRLWTYDPDYLEARRKRKAERPKRPSPPAGEGGPRSGSDEGSTEPLRLSCRHRGEWAGATLQPSASPTPSPARGEGFDDP